MNKVGEGIMGRLNLGGAGAGLRPGTNDLSASQMMPRNEMGTYRSQLGLDKSVDNFKIGFGNQFGAQLGHNMLG